MNEIEFRKQYQWRRSANTSAFILSVFVSLFTRKGVLRPFNSDPAWTPIFDQAFVVCAILFLATALMSARCPACKGWLRSDGRRCRSCERHLGASVTGAQS